MVQATHEDFSTEKPVAAGSDRSFGFVMAGVSALIGLYNGWHQGRIWTWALAVSLILLIAALAYPPILGPLNRAWLKFGLLIHKIVNPLIMGLIYFGVVWPTGLVMRTRGKDLLRLKFDPNAKSYWIVRQPPGPAPDTMKEQF